MTGSSRAACATQYRHQATTRRRGSPRVRLVDCPGAASGFAAWLVACTFRWLSVRRAIRRHGQAGDYLKKSHSILTGVLGCSIVHASTSSPGTRITTWVSSTCPPAFEGAFPAQRWLRADGPRPGSTIRQTVLVSTTNTSGISVSTPTATRSGAGLTDADRSMGIRPRDRRRRTTCAHLRKTHGSRTGPRFGRKPAAAIHAPVGVDIHGHQTATRSDHCSAP